MSVHPEIHPQRAIVAPRASRHPDGETLPLEMQLRDLLGLARPALVNIFGPPGSGKTTALAHLAAVLPAEKVLLLDDAPAPSRINEGPRLLTVFTSHVYQESDVAFALASWEDDDLIEYVLHAHRERSKEIMPRVLGAADRARVAGLPELWAPVLDAFAADPAVREIGAALRIYLHGQLGAAFTSASEHCLQCDLCAVRGKIEPATPPTLPSRLLRHPLVRSLLSAERLATEISAGHFEALKGALPQDLMPNTGRLFVPKDPRLATLERALPESPWLQSPAISLLLASDRTWRPSHAALKNFRQCQAAGAQWNVLDLRDCDMHGANLQGADLRESRLGRTVADAANFSGANLRLADLRLFKGNHSEFSRADFTEVRAERARFEDAVLEGAIFRLANLEGAVFNHACAPGACFERAMLRRASFRNAEIDGADFSCANLSAAHFQAVRFKDVRLDGACLARAHLLQCNLEELAADDVNFEGANLTGSYLTASTLARANFQGAALRNTGLAEVQWENADLRDADLRGATFHMGSSRSGRVNSTIASEGTRTGFYTDEYNEQDYKAPEEIRKANLCGADLRGALVHETDFYLVDLRDAKYTLDQAKHFASCGAILRARC